MATNHLHIGELARRSGVSRKALRLYEQAEILTPLKRTPAGYRVYDPKTLGVVAFLRRAQRLGFTLDEIKEIVRIKRAGAAPCPHVRALVRRKAEELDQRLKDLKDIREGLRTLLNDWPSKRRGKAVVCPHIESSNGTKGGDREWRGEKEKSIGALTRTVVAKSP